MRAPDAEPTAVLPQTAKELVELERVQQELAQSEERAKNHWDQYLRAVAELENVRSARSATSRPPTAMALRNSCSSSCR